jgi:hypothetical protein
MTVAATINRIDYRGDGSTTVFPIPFRFLADADIGVWIRDLTAGTQAVKTITTHYTLSGAGSDPPTGQCTMVTAPTSSERLTILRSTAPTQPIDFETGGAFPADDNEAALDRAILAIQDLEEQLSRATLIQVTDTDAPPDAEDLTVLKTLAMGKITGAPTGSLHPFDFVRPVALAATWVDLAIPASGNAYEMNGCADDFTDEIVPIYLLRIDADTDLYFFPAPVT